MRWGPPLQVHEVDAATGGGRVRRCAGQLGFLPEHRGRIPSSNTVEWLSGEVKGQTEKAAILPVRAGGIGLESSALARQHEE